MIFRSYPGAGAQTLNIEQKLGVGRRVAEQVAKKGAAAGAELATGGSTFGVAGTVAHEYVGGKFEKMTAKELEKLKKAQLANEQSNFRPISEFTKD